MNKYVILSLKATRKFFETVNLKPKTEIRAIGIGDFDIVADMIVDILTKDEPCMIARFGSNEIYTVWNYLGVTKYRNKFLGYIKGQMPPWWWEPNIIKPLHIVAGFFPPTEEKLEQFCKLMLADMKHLDIMGAWVAKELFFQDELKNVKKVQLLTLDPFWAKNPWTSALEYKKVLVVHPFAETIENQYKKRELLFKNNLLPEFELKTIKAVQSGANTKTPFSDWFEALDYMKSEIDKIDYDICLIGAGAYGFPLAAHVKRSGKKGFHIGGSLQLLFGIKGKRWESNYSAELDYGGLVNQHWVRPLNEEKPANANQMEGGCYW